MDLILDLISWACIIAGGSFLVIDSVGVLRMPDVYTRMHAASLTDTMGAGMIMVGLMVQSGFNLVTVKLLLILLFLMLTGPVATHALAGTALTSNLRPRLKHDFTDGSFSGPMVEARRSGHVGPDLIGEDHR